MFFWDTVYVQLLIKIDSKSFSTSDSTSRPIAYVPYKATH